MLILPVKYMYNFILTEDNQLDQQFSIFFLHEYPIEWTQYHFNCSHIAQSKHYLCFFQKYYKYKGFL